MMRTAQLGDCVQVHFTQRCQDGRQRSSYGKDPLELIVGTDHRRLPGLGTALVGLAPGDHARVRVPPEQAYGVASAARIFRLTRSRFPEHLDKGLCLRIRDRHGRERRVRVLESNERMVVVDANHPWAGQALEIEVELVAFKDAP